MALRCFYLRLHNGGRIALHNGGFLRLHYDCVALGGLVLGREITDREKLESSGIREMFEFWRDYFRDVMGFTEARARVRAEELLWIARWDDEDLIDLEIL